MAFGDHMCGRMGWLARKGQSVPQEVSGLRRPGDVGLCPGQALMPPLSPLSSLVVAFLFSLPLQFSLLPGYGFNFVLLSFLMSSEPLLSLLPKFTGFEAAVERSSSVSNGLEFEI